MHVSVWVLALIGLVNAEVKLYSPEAEAEASESLATVDVDANAAVHGKDPVTKGAAKIMILSIFDKNNDQCIDQAEFANAMILNPLIGLPGEGHPAAWALASLQKGRIDPETVAPYKWCPKNKMLEAAQTGDVEEELDDEEEFENPHVKKNITCKKGTRESHYMKESCAALVKGTIGKIPLVGPAMAKPYISVVEDMCRVLFPGPCVMGPKETSDYMKPAFSSMEGVSSCGWFTSKLSEEEYSKDVDTATKTYTPPGVPATPENAFHHPNLQCGVDWEGKYWEKNISITKMKPKDLIPGSPDYSPLTLFFMIRSFLQKKEIGELKNIFTDDADSLVEVAVYVAEKTSESSMGVCVVAWQETQDKPRGSDWKMNMAADLVKFGETGVKGRAHKGLLRAYKALSGTVKAYIDAGPCADPAKVEKIIFAGYSAGGGMAAMNFVHAKQSWANLMDKESGQKAYLITAGAPPIGDIEFCESNFNDGKTYQVASFTDAIVTGTLAGDLGVVVMGLMQIHHCSKIHWIECPANASDCHSQDGVYSAWAMKQNHSICNEIDGTGPAAPAPPGPDPGPDDFD